MKTLKIIIVGLLFLGMSLLAEGQTTKSGTTVDIITNKGTITVLLYDETPVHRDNFVKLVKENFYNDIMYHRVISGFLIQVGDPRSRRSTGASEESIYSHEIRTIPAEINPAFYHRRGVLNAARMGEAVNPYLESSSTHFTIIQGRVQTDSTLNAAERRIESFYRAHLQSMYTFELKQANPEYANNDSEEKQKELQAEVDKKIAAKMIEVGSSLKIPQAHREVYKTVGGAPHLDFNYTVFGEVLSGMEVVDAIASVPVDRERPTEEVYIIRMQLR